MDSSVVLSRIADMPYTWTGTGFRVYCLELRSPTECLHVAILGDNELIGAAILDHISRDWLEHAGDDLSRRAAEKK